MPISPKLTAAFEEQMFYHIICKSIQGIALFKNDDNKRFFLQRYQYYLSPFIDTYAFCLLNNHVHFLVRVKTLAAIEASINAIPVNDTTITQQLFMERKVSLDVLLEKQFNSFLVSYTRAFNNFLLRKGHVFVRPFKRIAVTESAHFMQLVIYIHANPLKHGLTNELTNYKWSSYQAIVTDSYTNIKRAEVLDWFNNKEQFIAIHQEQSRYHYTHPLSAES